MLNFWGFIFSPPFILFLLISSSSQTCCRSWVSIDTNKNLSWALREAIPGCKRQQERSGFEESCRFTECWAQDRNPQSLLGLMDPQKITPNENLAPSLLSKRSATRFAPEGPPGAAPGWNQEWCCTKQGLLCPGRLCSSGMLWWDSWTWSNPPPPCWAAGEALCTASKTCLGS